MNHSRFSLRTSMPLLLALTLAGCGGGGGGSKATPTSISKAAFKNANVEGSFDTPDKAQSRAKPATKVTVQFANDNTSGTGVASFVTGSSDDPTTFAAYAADISNLDFNVVSNTTTAVSGTVTFSLTNFTTNKYLAGTATFSGTYTVDPSGHLAMTGAITGKDANGAATTANVTLSYQVGATTIDLSGTYSGSATYLGLSLFDFKNATLAKVSGDGLHLNGTIPFTPPNSTVETSLTFKGAYTHDSLSGATTVPADISATTPLGAVTIAKGTVAQVYLTQSATGKISGSLLATVSALGSTQTVVLGLSGQKGTTTGGGGGGTTTSSFATGYYDGGIKAANGQLNGQILKLNVAKVSSTAGANGALIIKTNSVTDGPNVGARIASISGTGSNFTLTADNFTSTYTKMVITGTVAASSGGGAELNATYTGTLLDGSTVTGSFDSLAKVTQSNASLNGTYGGTLAEMGTSNTTPFTGTFKTNADGTLTVTTASAVQGVTLPPITGYVAGTSIALKDSSEGTTLPSPYTGDVLFGNFDGEVSGNAIAGKYVVFLNNASGTAVFVQYGSLSLTKQ